MQAVVYTEYGPPDVLRFAEVPKPAPRDDEVLVRIHAASLNALDYRFLGGRPRFIRLFTGGLRKPRETRPGVDFAGSVETAGRNVTQCRPGDEVFGACDGALAEYACVREDRLTPKPANVSFEEAAAVPVAAISALQGLRDKGRIQSGRRVLIEGASGGVGTFAVQIAKWFGAEVTAVCSTGNVDTARSMGAQRVVDYTREDFTRGGERYDLILGANAHRSIFDYRRVLSPDGIFVMVGGGWAPLFQTMLLGPILSRTGSRKACFFVAKLNKPDLALLGDLLAARKIVPVIDRRYPFREVVEAFRYVVPGHARGKVVVTVAP
jgi:NADPH:quinone reductase-like Zn-dependent oxidoreductase